MNAKGRGTRRNWFFALAAVLAVVLAIALVLWMRALPPSPKLLEEARLALVQQRDADALRLATSYLARAPESVAARFYAAESAHRLGRSDEALKFLEHILPEDASEQAIEAFILAANIHFLQGHAWEAEQRYRQALKHRPRDVYLNRQMSFLLTVEGRRWESRPHLLELVSQRQNTLEELILLGDIWPDYALAAELQRFRKASPHDPLPLLGLARTAARHQETASALEMLRQVVKRYPHLVEAHAWLGWTLLQSAEGTAELASWEAQLPAGAADHPMIWLVRGMGAEQTEQREAAVRCFWEAFSRDPNYELAAYQLSRALTAIKEDDNADLLRERTEQLYKLAALLKRVHSDRDDLARLSGGVASLAEVAEMLESLGRTTEARAWYDVIAAADPTMTWAQAEAERLAAETARPMADGDAPLQLDFSGYPLPEWPQSSQAAAAGPLNSAAAAVRFVDSAAACGIEFTYFNGDVADDARLLGTTGGGVAVLDYDGDSWPDLYFTQGCSWPIDPAKPPLHDRLFRNSGNGRFEDVTQAAGLGDLGFSQGAAIGDFNNDGHPDIYLANVGANRLYVNNGDGTFTDIAPEAGITSDDWTTSCLIADLNGDALPDLYDVNYVGGDALTRRCQSGPCPPHLFPAQDDRLLLNWGDGTFRDVTRQAGIRGERGKGLGIVAADFDASGRLSLFIANDGTPNFFYRNETAPGNAVPRFAENGVKSGLAFDRAGSFQACMGVAADDANGDGFLELFVTNFYNESNTLYVPEVPGEFYSDRTIELGLRDGSLQMLGFGTQFIDGELDGWPDLILTNGHVQDLSKQGVPYRMRAQYYRNLGGEHFTELNPESLGPFFQEGRLGRGLARLDWNRDGREDVAISHTGSPAALLTNQTNPTGHFLAIQLRGVTSSRDAIGASVRAEAGGRTLVRQLTGGDGYQASNQRQLVFGLGNATQIDRLEIRWPSGITQIFSNVAADTEYLAVESADSLVRLAKPGTIP